MECMFVIFWSTYVFLYVMQIPQCKIRILCCSIEMYMYINHKTLYHSGTGLLCLCRVGKLIVYTNCRLKIYG